MLILSNALTDVPDEGCLKVAGSLVKRMIEKQPQTTVITYERQPKIETIHLSLNKFLVNKPLRKLLKEKNQPLLYIPFPAKEWATALRVFLLSCFNKKEVTILFTMLCKCGWIGRLLFKLSGANIITLSQSTLPTYWKMVGKERVTYLKTGVDTEKFHPVSKEKAKELKIKYGLDPEKPVVLHVGHLKYGRNIGELMKLNEEYQVVLAVSTLTKSQQDQLLKQELLQCPNVKLIEEYLPNIEELYQLADVYFFPVVAKGNCIDVPLSCLEAASCNTSVVTTTYGEMNEFRGKNGFWFIESFEKEPLNKMIEEALKTEPVFSREQVAEYDWNRAIALLNRLN